MGRREKIIDKTLAALTAELGATPEFDQSELREVCQLQGELNGQTISVTVARYPAGENPTSWDGQEHWSVDVFGPDGENLDRPHNPEPTLDLAFQMVDWRRIRETYSDGLSSVTRSPGR